MTLPPFLDGGACWGGVGPAPPISRNSTTGGPLPGPPFLWQHSAMWRCRTCGGLFPPGTTAHIVGETNEGAVVVGGRPCGPVEPENTGQKPADSRLVGETPPWRR